MANLLIIDDDPTICEFLKVFADSWGHTATATNSSKKGLKLIQNKNYDLILLDLELPDGNGIQILPDLINAPTNPEVIIITGTGDINGAQLAFKYGAWDYITKPFTIEEIALPVSRALTYRAEKSNNKAQTTLKQDKIIGSSAAIRSCLEDVARASATDASILITGETGTGKELFARAIHENSKRVSSNFVPLDCGAVPESLSESIFFGSLKGSYTGSSTHKDGIILEANGGTLFLDEIGDLPLKIQMALLRALQEKCIRPIGSNHEIPVDFRLVAATNRDLNVMVAQNQFREDLLFRVRAIEIKLPPLRERDRDIEEITLAKIHQMCKYYGANMKGISTEFMDVLTSQKWPGNVRELINVLEYALASAGADPTIYPKHLPPEYRVASLHSDSHITQSTPHSEFTDSQTPNQHITFAQHRSQSEILYLKQLIKKSNGNRKTACQLSGLSQSHLYGLLKKYNLSLSDQK